MIRVWNCNGDRVAVSKGIKKIKIFHENKMFFFGDIKKGSTNMDMVYENYENILFTFEPKILI